MLVILCACTATPKKDLALDRVRGQLDDLKSNTELAGYAPLATGEAERAVRKAEMASGMIFTVLTWFIWLIVASR